MDYVKGIAGNRLNFAELLANADATGYVHLLHNFYVKSKYIDYRQNHGSILV